MRSHWWRADSTASAGERYRASVVAWQPSPDAKPLHRLATERERTATLAHPDRRHVQDIDAGDVSQPDRIRPVVTPPDALVSLALIRAAYQKDVPTAPFPFPINCLVSEDSRKWCLGRRAPMFIFFS